MMRCRPLRLFILVLTAGNTLAQTAGSDTQVTQTVIAEIRQLRNDLQTTAATIQRVQIVMYRLQSQSVALDRASQRLEQARGACSQAQSQQKMLAGQVERVEAQKGRAQNPAEQKSLEEVLANMKSSIEMWTGEEQQCQVERSQAEGQFRAEQARMSELQEQLEKLDKLLAGFGVKQAPNR